jgi:hypothetical protein
MRQTLAVRLTAANARTPSVLTVLTLDSEAAFLLFAVFVGAAL